MAGKVKLDDRLAIVKDGDKATQLTYPVMAGLPPHSTYLTNTLFNFQFTY
jgi:hypothetical protein